MHPLPAIGGSDEVGVVVLNSQIIDRDALFDVPARYGLHVQRLTNPTDDLLSPTQIAHRDHLPAGSEEEMLRRTGKTLRRLPGLRVDQLDRDQLRRRVLENLQNRLQFCLAGQRIAGPDLLSFLNLLNRLRAMLCLDDGSGHEAAALSQTLHPFLAERAGLLHFSYAIHHHGGVGYRTGAVDGGSRRRIPARMRRKGMSPRDRVLGSRPASSFDGILS